jgi:hypothetical protein
VNAKIPSKEPPDQTPRVDKEAEIGYQMKLSDFATGWCAANCSAADTYNPVDCGPIRSSVIEAIVDQAPGNYEDFRDVDRDGLLCVAIPLAERE